MVRLKDVATVDIGGQNTNSVALSSGKRSVFMTISPTPDGNPLEIVASVKALISKHGILMVSFANDMQQHDGVSKLEAIRHSAGVRMRPVLMTTAAMVAGLIPLLFAAGAGASSRFALGIVVVMGMLVGTFFTLFVLPTLYVLIAGDHRVKHQDDAPAATKELAHD